MLGFIRKTLTSWPVLALLGLILVAFAVTGIGDPFGSGSAPTGSIAKVGGTVVTENQLQQQIDRVVRAARQRDPAATQTQLAKEGGVPVLAEQLIGTTAMEVLGRKIGISASDRAIGAEIGSIPAFQSGGKFDDATYRRVLGENRMSDRELRSSITGDLVRRQLVAPITAASQVPLGMALPYVQLLANVHKGAIAIVPLAPGAAPTEAELATYYAANKARFTLPERRAFRYALIDRAAVAAKAAPTDAEITAAFDKDRAKYGGDAVRTLSQVVVPDEAKARAVADAAKKEGFAAAAQRIAGFAPADTTLGEQTQSKFGAATSSTIAAAAFALPTGGITAPIKSDFGWHVVKVDAIGASGKTLAQARPEVIADLSKRAADTALAALVNKIEDGAEAGKSFADIAQTTGITIQTSPPATKDGRTGADAKTVLAAPLTALAAKAFGREPADGVGVEDIGGGTLAVIETTQIVPPTPQPLAEVRDLVTAAVARDKALKAAKIKADAVVAAVKKGTPFAAAVAAQGLAVPQPVAGRKMDVLNQQNVPGVITAFLDTPVNTVRALPGDGGWVLIHAESIEPGAPAAMQAVRESTRRDIAAQAPGEIAQAFAAAAAKTVGVERNAAQIAAVVRRLTGQDAR